MKKLFLIFSLICSPCYADVFQVDQISKDDLQAIYRGWPANTGQCAVDVIREIRIDQQSGMFWVITTDETKPIIDFTKIDKTQQIICDVDGRHNIDVNPDGSIKSEIVTPY